MKQVETATREQFAAAHNVSRTTVRRWLRSGWATLAPGTDRVAVEASNKLLRLRCPKYRGGTAKDSSRNGNSHAGLDSLDADEREMMEHALDLVMSSLCASRNERCSIDSLIVAINTLLYEWLVVEAADGSTREA